ncbi:MAG: phosphoadenylyl-sulfate reductase [Planctomycetaceae bacterium]|nr:phosphoadenylyl-sulfate reductase [Planctomycetaceae bacterium]MDP7274469.1 phosphoadenylyl-sulfate reductase [Planctomycetaceae bacterium]
MPRLTQADLADRNRTFESRSPQELLKWAIETFPGRVAAISAIQQAGSIICHMIGTLKLEIPVLFVDTGVNFPETLATRDAISSSYGLDLRTLQPKQTMEEQTAERGVIYLTTDGQKECCRLRKIEPLAAVADDFDCLISSLRRTDEGQRSLCPILTADPAMNVLRLAPLVNFDDANMAQYLDSHDVIVNPLHAQGYPTVSCNRCTTPVVENEPRRAGRWRHLGPWQAYCGINPTDLDMDTKTSIELAQPLIDRILGREADFMI